MCELRKYSDNEEYDYQDSFNILPQNRVPIKIPNEVSLDRVLQKKQQGRKNEERENQKKNKEMKQTKKIGQNMNKIDLSEKSFEIYNKNEDNQFEHPESYDKLYEKQKGQRKHGSQRKLKTQSQVLSTHQPDVQQSSYLQDVNKKPKNQIKLSKQEKNQQITELDQFLQRDFVNLSGNNTNKGKNIKKYYLSIFFKFLANQAKGQQNLMEIFKITYERRQLKTKTHFPLSFGKLELEEFKFIKIKGSYINLNYDEAKKIFKFETLKSKSFDDINNYIKDAQNNDDVEQFKKYVKLVKNKKDNNGMKESNLIAADDIKQLFKSQEMADFLDQIIIKIFPKEPQEPDKILFQELKIMFDNQETYLKTFLLSLKNFFQKQELGNNIKQFTNKEKIKHKQEKKLNEECQKQEQTKVQNKEKKKDQ